MASVKVACSRHGPSMKPRITLITIGVDDLERALRFYPQPLSSRRTTPSGEVTRVTFRTLTSIRGKSRGIPIGSE